MAAPAPAIASQQSFPCRRTVHCSACGFGVERECTTAADLVWKCSECAPATLPERIPTWQEVYYGQIRYPGIDRAIASADGRTWPGYQPVVPRELANARRVVDQLMHKDELFLPFLECVRRQLPNGPQNAAIAHWYWRGNFSYGEIATWLGFLPAEWDNTADDAEEKRAKEVARAKGIIESRLNRLRREWARYLEEHLRERVLALLQRAHQS